MSSTKIILVGCGKSKAEGARAARDLYTGNLFRAARAFAEGEVAAGRADGWLILSGKYGILAPDKIVAPYDEKAPGAAVQMRAWGERVVETLRTRYAHAEVAVTLLAGILYTVPVRHQVECLRLPWTVSEPLAGMEIGERLSWFKSRRAEAEAATLPAGKAKKVLERDAARARARQAKLASLTVADGETLEIAATVACPVCFAKEGARACFKPIGASRWELLGHGVVHTDRVLEARARRDAAARTAVAVAKQVAPEVACPYCGAAARAPCRSGAGTVRGPHAPRLAPGLAEKQARAECESAARAAQTEIAPADEPTRAVPCPVCRAKAGSPCRSPSGHKAMRLHADRRADYVRPPPSRPDCSRCGIVWAHEPCRGWDPAWGMPKCRATEAPPDCTSRATLAPAQAASPTLTTATDSIRCGRLLGSEGHEGPAMGESMPTHWTTDLVAGWVPAWLREQTGCRTKAAITAKFGEGARFEIPLQLEPGADEEEEEIRALEDGAAAAGEGSTPGGRRAVRAMEQLALFA